MTDRYADMDKPSWSLIRCILMLGPRLGFNYWRGNWEFFEENQDAYFNWWSYYKSGLDGQLTEDEEDFVWDLDQYLRKMESKSLLPARP